MSAGFLYVLTNPSMPGLVKVGKTVRDPRIRVKELSSPTGVPTPFELAYVEAFDDCHTAERRVHAALAAGGIRVSSKREFFEADPQTVQELMTRQRRIELGRRRESAWSRVLVSVLFGLAGLLCLGSGALFLWFTSLGSGGTLVAAILAFAGLELLLSLPLLGPGTPSPRKIRKRMPTR